MNSNLQHLALEQAELLISNQEAGKSSGHFNCKIARFQPWIANSQKKL
jgi:hypothetical protein